ncbi:MAG: 16S rRNA (cytosine(1402)-N(4))-methyltransferase RsmH [Desulfobacterales bacterium]
MAYRHIPVMLNEAIHYLNCRPGKTYTDCTLGGSGHAKAICERILPDGLLIGIDQDIDAITNAQKALQSYSSNIHLFHGNFKNLPQYLARINIDAVDGILLDLGLSLHQLESSGRGFSFQKDEPLDMRMDKRSATRARDLINDFSEDALRKIFKDLGEERWSKQIARSIVKRRRQEKIQTSRQLAQIVSEAVPRRKIAEARIHPATRVFMALRIAVNRELEVLSGFMAWVADWLNPAGRLCVLSFHSLEDRIVKQQIKAMEKGCICPPKIPECACGKKPVMRALTKKVVRPTEAEVARNPMARSTRLRAAVRI